MSSWRTWVVAKLQDDKDDYGPPIDARVEKIGAHGLRIARKGRPDALVYCAAADRGFELGDLESALEELEGTQFVVVAPGGGIADEVVERSDEIGICVDGFGELRNALQLEHRVGEHRPGEHRYIVRRLNARRVVRRVSRRGVAVYEIDRRARRSLTAVMTEGYELTGDEVYTLLERYAHFDIDAVVATSPNARGLSREALRAGEVAGVEVLLLNEFIDRLGDPWT